MKQSQIHVIDLTKIEGAGDFPCPNCGVIISPEDESERIYQVIDTKVREGSLEELTILCNNCRLKIRIIGFLPS